MKTQKCTRSALCGRQKWVALSIGPVWPRLGAEGPLRPLCLKKCPFFDLTTTQLWKNMNRTDTWPGVRTNILTCPKMYPPFDSSRFVWSWILMFYWLHCLSVEYCRESRTFETIGLMCIDLFGMFVRSLNSAFDFNLCRIWDLIMLLLIRLIIIKKK